MSKILTELPNILTVSRIILAPIFFILFIYGYYIAALICFFIASTTDILDGFIARKFNLVSKFGKLYDPLADKILMFLGFACIFIFPPDFNDLKFLLSDGTESDIYLLDTFDSESYDGWTSYNSGLGIPLDPFNSEVSQELQGYFVHLSTLYEGDFKGSFIEKRFISGAVGSFLNLSAQTMIYLILIIFIIRDLIVTALRENKLKQDKIILKTSFVAKLKTVMMFISIHLYLIYYIFDNYIDTMALSVRLAEGGYDYAHVSAVLQNKEALKYTLLAFEVGLYFTLLLSLWSLYSYSKQYRNKSA